MNSPIIELNWTSLMILFNIAILYFIMKRFFFEKIHNFMVARENAIKDAFESADNTNKMAMEKLETYNKQLAQIEGEGREIIQKAKTKADNHALDILNEANVKASNIMTQAEKEIERQQTKAISEMKKEVGTLALMAAEKIMEKNLEDSGEQDEIIDKILKEAGTSGWQN
jgi:F-type H+-transporting ATPase subunit b